MVARNDPRPTPWQLPGLPPTVVDRPRLIARLDRALEHALTWVHGPAGWGKSVLTGQWCRRQSGLPVAWFDAGSVGHDEALPGALIAAVEHLLGTETGLADAEWTQPIAVEQQRRLAAALGATPPGVLVVDRIASERLGGLLIEVAAVAHGVDDCGLHIVATSRATPPATLMPLALRGGADLIGPDDLGMDAGEVTAVLGALGVPIDASTAEELRDQLRGWIAGARILGLSYRGDPGPPADELLMAGAEGIEAYVTAELLQPLDDGEREFLLVTAAAERLNPALCDTIARRPDSDSRLRRLRQRGLPLVRADDGSGQLAHLTPIRNALDRIAAAEMPTERAAALRAAAQWYSEHDLPFEAARCYVRLDDWDAVVGVIYLHMRRILETDQIGALAKLVSTAPTQVLREQAELALGGAFVLRMDGQIAAAFELVATFEPYLSEHGRAAANLIRSAAVSWVSDVEDSLAYATTAIAICDELGDDGFIAERIALPVYTHATDDTYRTLAHSYALLACGYAGLWHAGEQHLVDVSPATAATLPQLQVVQRHGSRATYFALAGQAARAASEAGDGLASAASGGITDHRSAADAEFAVGEALRLQLRHADAAAPLARSRELAQLNGRVNLLATITAAQAHLAVDRGDHPAALHLLAEHRSASRQRLPKVVAGLLASAEARALVAAGDVHRALRALDRAPATPATATAQVTALLSLGQIANARDALDRWPDDPTVDAAVRRRLAAAAVDEAAGRRVDADGAFREALRLAADEQLMQPFVEVGPVVARLLQRGVGNEIGTAELELAVALRSAIVGGQVAAATPRLSAREATVLALLAEGRSAREIAEEIHLSVNTVKSHLQAVYRKLGVTSKIEALRAYAGTQLSARE